MKYLSLICLLFVAGCNIIPKADESIILPEPVIIDKVDQVPSKPVPMPAPKQDKPSVLEPEQPVKVATVPTTKANTKHWSYPGSTSDDANRSKLRVHLAGKPHYLSTEGMSAVQVLDLHDALHIAEQNGTASTTVTSTVTKTAPVVRSTVQQYTIASCGICKSDMRDVLPNWTRQGWTVLEPIDESANPRGFYPRYEIRGADGSFRTHVGTLKNWK